MEASIRRLALRSATKVALGSLVGCGGVIATVQQPDEPDAHVDASAHVDGKSNETLACTGPVEVDAGDVTPETFACCLSDVQTVVGDASPWDPNGPDASLVASDPSADNCCRAILARLGHEPDGGSFSSDYMAAAQGEVLQWCCRATGDLSGAACTPWGPPTPPAMEVA
jgi:hypothetical protein